jgi:hypothetical protein
MSNSYKEILGIYNSSSNKEENKKYIIQFLLEKLKEDPNNYELRVLMETQFMRDIKCNYLFFLTPSNVGCDLRELVFNIADQRSKTEILSLISKNKPGLIPHILTDIDDTLYPNFHGVVETSGSDTSWINKQPYPGLKKFYELFHKNIKMKTARYTTILSGTPVFLKQARVESKLIQNILGSNFGFIQGFDRKRDAVKALLQGMIERPFYKIAVSNNSLADIKFEKYIQYKQLFPEYKLLFIGDNGQGDLLAGMKMIKEDPTCLIFIHNLLRREGFIHTDDEIMELKRQGQNRLYFFKNYLELGYQFFKLRYISQVDYNDLRKTIALELQEPKNEKDPYLNHHYFHYDCPIEGFPAGVCINSKKTRRASNNKSNRTRRALRPTGFSYKSVP